MILCRHLENMDLGNILEIRVSPDLDSNYGIRLITGAFTYMIMEAYFHQVVCPFVRVASIYT